MFRDEPLVTIAMFQTTFDASIARGALESIGIPAFVPGETLGSFSTLRGGILGTQLQVFESDRERALVELRRVQIQVVQPPPANDA